MDFTLLSGNVTESMGSAAVGLINVGSYVAGVGGTAARLAAGPKKDKKDPELAFARWIGGFFGLGGLLSGPFTAAAAQGSVAGATPNAQPVVTRLPAYGAPGM
jgi:hypothetical protein